MKIKVLGGSGSLQKGVGLTGFLINGHVVLDAGTVPGALTVNEQADVTHVVLSHAHLDHISGLPFMVDNIAGLKGSPLQILASGPVLQTLSENIFNGKVWPDFTKIPSPKKPAMKFRELTPGREARIDGGLSIKPFRVNHSVPTTGYIIRENGKSVVYSGDTGATEDIWKAASRLGSALAAVFVETSFPDRMQDLADRTGHLTPRSLKDELKKITGYEGPVFVYHVKSQYLDEIKRELRALKRGVKIVRGGMDITV
jgi:cAMP phosphodiesterase